MLTTAATAVVCSRTAIAVLTSSPHLIWVLVFLAIRADRVGVQIRGLSTVMLLFVLVFAAYTLLTYPGIHVWGGPVQAYGGWG